MNLIKTFALNKSRLLKAPELDLSSEAKSEFEAIYNDWITKGNGAFIPYESNYPVSLFLNYIIETKNILVHGSNNPSIDCFEPKDSTLFNGKPVKAVFAASDGNWSLFFAVVKKEGYSGSIRNLCLTAPTKKGVKRYYYFSVNRNVHWTDGTIYFFPKEPFKQGGIRNEWISESPVEPLAKLAVKPEDFPFWGKVSRHSETESALKTILKAFTLRK
ncbi:hypothetical protein [Alteribacter keqinensis]|uniref:Uncharacterized protein n=1 Tax=Alteribacter keqinensis TaxID=2483800 RepID=A0A3M7TPC1_9BACI|nr:hypothetical protein [Alteribacter keqinensis]RNA66867.1 hypothetical protein EBO34_16825 [Alteribacter keqinensis]